MRENVSRDSEIHTNVTYLVAETYFACVKPLYSTLGEGLQVDHIDYKHVASISYELPKFLAEQIEIIGNFTSNSRPMELEYISCLLHGWTMISNEYFEKLFTSFDFQKTKFPVLQDSNGINMIKELVADKINQCINETTI